MFKLIHYSYWYVFILSAKGPSKRPYPGLWQTNINYFVGTYFPDFPEVILP